jgi:hypothetical protein
MVRIFEVLGSTPLYGNPKGMMSSRIFLKGGIRVESIFHDGNGRIGLQ